MRCCRPSRTASIWTSFPAAKLANTWDIPPVSILSTQLSGKPRTWERDDYWSICKWTQLINARSWSRRRRNVVSKGRRGRRGVKGAKGTWTGLRGQRTDTVDTHALMSERRPLKILLISQFKLRPFLASKSFYRFLGLSNNYPAACTAPRE